VKVLMTMHNIVVYRIQYIIEQFR